MNMFKVDMHVHTLLGGDAATRPDEVVPRAKLAGLDAVCITEHHSYDLSKPFDAISRDSGFPIFRGMEYRAREGHLLVFGVPAGKSDLMPGLPMQHAIDWINKRGGAAVPAHPYQATMSGLYLGSKLLKLQGITAIETLNASATDKENQQAQNAAQHMDLPGIGGSDAHGPLTIGRGCTLFPYPLATLADLVEALKNGDFKTG